MTGKRFTYLDASRNKYIGSFFCNDTPLTTEETVELLNTLNNENEQLKCENKNLKSTLNDFINICNRLQSNPTDKQTLSVARDMLQNIGVEIE